MKPILLVNPSNRKGIYQNLADDFSAIEPPIWCRLLGSYLKAKGFPVDIYDSQLYLATMEHTGELLVKDMNPSMVVVVVYGQQPSASTQTMPAAIEICKSINDFSDGKMPLVVVGTHPAALPAETLKETNADIVCTGEGFVTIEEVARLVKNYEDRWKYHIRPNNPRGACYWDHDEPQFTNPAPLVWDVEEIPGFMWSKLEGMNRKQYRAHNWHAFGHQDMKPYASIYTSLGCPYKCSFCCIQAPFAEGDELKLKGKANSYRRWSAEHVVAEIEYLAVAYGVKHIKISDEMFLLNRSHVEEICDRLKAAGFSEKHLNMWFYSRVDTVGHGDDLLKKMKGVGFNWAALGIESVQPDVMDNVDKRDFSGMDVMRAVRQLQDNGISVIGNYIFGLPGDTDHSMRQTLEFAQSLNTEFVNMYCAVAFPGSRLYEEAFKRGLIPRSWSAYSFHAHDHEPLPTETLTSAEVLAFRDWAFHEYMNSAWYQSLIRKKFGQKAVDEINSMLEIKLERKLLE